MNELIRAITGPVMAMERLAEVESPLAKALSRGQKYLQPRVILSDLPAGRIGQYGLEGVSLDRNALAKLNPAARAELVRHEMAHAADAELGTWKDTHTYLWNQWQNDKNHPIFDVLPERRGARHGFNSTIGDEILAELYSTDYPTGKFAVFHGADPARYGGSFSEELGTHQFPIPSPLMSAMSKIDDRLGIWKKRQQRAIR